MKVFISWSGTRSRRVAELLHWWVKCVIQAVDPWVSSSDADRGTLWFSEIVKELSSTTHGIICITGENKVRPWILFEAGALAKGLESSRIYTFLVDLQPADLENPLAQFNATRPNKDDLYRLVFSINNGLENRLKDDILRKAFETYWPQFEEHFGQIINETAADAPPEEPRPKEDILNEILNSVRSVDKRVRMLENTPEIVNGLNMSTPLLRPEAASAFVKSYAQKTSDWLSSSIGSVEVRQQVRHYMNAGLSDEEILGLLKKAFPASQEDLLKAYIAAGRQGK